jgi:hypothetical protein
VSDIQIILTEADGFLSATVLYIRMGFDLSKIDPDDIQGSLFPHLVL